LAPDDKSGAVSFLEALLRDGVVRFQQRPGLWDSTGEARSLLARAYADYALEIAGPELRFVPEIALAAADVLRYACWFLVSHDEPGAELEARLRMPRAARSPAEHLSADLTFRFLPRVYRRAKAHHPDDLLVKLLGTVLRSWPLSGVLSDIEEAPLVPPEFDGHVGLWMLYAERLAHHEKSAWFLDGAGQEYVELVWRELGKDTRGLLRNRTPNEGVISAQAQEDDRAE
jgi:hypothetical protein